jgi:hypothetical protein
MSGAVPGRIGVEIGIAVAIACENPVLADHALERGQGRIEARAAEPRRQHGLHQLYSSPATASLTTRIF